MPKTRSPHTVELIHRKTRMNRILGTFSIEQRGLQAVDSLLFSEEGKASCHSRFSHQLASLAFSL